MPSSQKRQNRENRERLQFFGPAIVLTLIGFVVAFQFMQPAPPRQIVIATGSPSGAYYYFGKAYAEILKKNGITVEVLNTAGSAENIRLLENKNNRVDVAFIQGGTGSLAKTKDIVSLGSLYFEPLWIFHKPGLSLKHLSDMRGLRIGVGGEGSGTRVLAQELLGLNGINEENTKMVSAPTQATSDMLLAGDLDIAFFVSSHKSATIRQLLQSDAAQLMGIRRAEAYALRYHFLHVLKLPEGSLDFAANIPAEDFTLVAPTTQLAARTDLHPALIEVLLMAAEKVHEQGGGFEQKGQFPAPTYLDFPLSESAERFYKYGPPFLQRYLPFWLASLLSRTKVLLLPLLVLLLPFIKVMPPIYQWRIRRRIYRWYSQLEAIDPEVNKDLATENLESHLALLDDLEDKVANIHMPLAHTDLLYHFRLHIDLLRKKLQTHREKEAGRESRLGTKKEGNF
ncbi:MAG: TAXI family TRAP transporter solute-binding subunit [Deltaproteobacteria bacterium]|nr:TAXI family TRAP transporter solute-binding subunit [Deltaproteobacteria bacterium]